MDDARRTPFVDRDPSHRVLRPGRLRPLDPARSPVTPAELGRDMPAPERPLVGAGQSGVRFIPIVSFPKSGNTWLRSIFSHLLYDGAFESIPNKYTQGPFVGGVAALPGGVQLRMYKSHDRILHGSVGNLEVRHVGAIHIIRHPLDVFLSLLNYMLLNPESVHPDLRPGKHSFAFPPASIEEILSGEQLDVFFKTFVLYGTLMPTFHAAGSWFEHNEYWLNRDGDDIPIFRLRYEDLLEKGAEPLFPVARALGRSAAAMTAAFEAAAADTAPDGKFFWKQKAGTYHEVLSGEQLDLFHRLLGERTAALGYTIQL